MELKTLADALRTGGSWQLANDRVFRWQHGESDFSDKSKASDFELVKAAATCADCGMSVSQQDIRDVVGKATNLQFFLNIIAGQIEHAADCSYQ